MWIGSEWTEGRRLIPERRASAEDSARYAAMVEQVAALVEMAEQAANVERDVFGSYEIPEMGAMWGGVLRNGAITESFAGVFGERW